jgi:uracil-DNA glycosylase family 4
MPRFSLACRRCPRLARHLEDVRERYRGYHARPVPPVGPARAEVLVVGLAPGLHGANRTGLPFVGDRAGALLYETLQRFGLATPAPGAGGFRPVGCRITNAVKCLPPDNRPLRSEVERCNPYLREEIAALPHRGAILALGRIAHDAVLLALGLPAARLPFAHGARHALPRGLALFDSYHCSRYNTSTGRLTPEMFRTVVAAVAQWSRTPR